MDGAGCRVALQLAPTKNKDSLFWLFRLLLSWALLTSVCVRGHGLSTASTCPSCGAAHEDETNIL